MSFPRYPAYKDSGVEWLGEIPAHWGVVPMRSVAQEHYIQNAGMICDNLLSLSYGKIIQKDINASDGLLPDSFETYQIVHPGLIVLRLTDLQNDKRSLRSAIVEDNGIITSAYTSIIPKSINPKFTHYLIRSYDLIKVFYSMGGGLRQTLKFQDLRDLPLLLPTEEEQIAISECLDSETAKIDSLIAEQEHLIALLKEKRQAVISHAVTKGLNPDVPMKEFGVEWLGQVPAHWTVTRLKFLAQVRSGVAKGREIAIEHALEVPYLRVANVQDGYLDLEDVARIQIAAHELDRYRLHPGDVLMNEGGDFDKLGRGHVWRGEIDDCIHQNHVFAVRPHDVEPEWISLLTSSHAGRFYFMSRSKQSTNLASISSSNIAEFTMPLPPLSERIAIMAAVTREVQRINDLVEQATSAITILQERRSALISAAVTGKIDVRELVKAQEKAA